MKITSNETFKQLLTEYNLPDNLSFSVDLPAEVKTILNDKIIPTEFGIILKSFDRLYKATHDWENQSVIEDNENHFHVDAYIEPADIKKAFMPGIKTSVSVANKFHLENITGIRFWYSYQTPELGQLWAKNNDLDEENDEYYVSNRISFYIIRKRETSFQLTKMRGQ